MAVKLIFDCNCGKKPILELYDHSKIIEYICPHCNHHLGYSGNWHVYTYHNINWDIYKEAAKRRPVFETIDDLSYNLPRTTDTTGATAFYIPPNTSTTWRSSWRYDEV